MAAEISKPDYSYQWASGGAIVAPSNVKIQTGWTAEVPPLQWENWSQNRQDNAILHLFQKGISEWDSVSNYYFTTSGVRSYVQGSDGTIYVAVADSIGQDPVTDTSHTYWDKAFVTGTLLNTRVFTTTQVYTPTVGTKLVDVEVQGAGGGGSGTPATGATTTAQGANGAAGAYSRKRISSAFSGVTITVGVGGTTGAGVVGGVGGASSFGSLVSAAGGGGGLFNGPTTATNYLTAMPAQAALPTLGDLNIRGSLPMINFTINSQGQTAARAQTMFGETFGAGGLGAAAGNSSAALAGAAGRDGLVIVREYA